MNLFNKIRDDAKKALKQGDSARLETLRFLISLIEKKDLSMEVGKMTEADVMNVLQTEMKRKKESREVFLKAGRKDLSDQTEEEIRVLSEYLPQQLSLEKLEETVKKVIKETGSEQGFGIIMGKVMGEVKGMADGAWVAQVVKKHLSLK